MAIYIQTGIQVNANRVPSWAQLGVKLDQMWIHLNSSGPPWIQSNPFAAYLGPIGFQTTTISINTNNRFLLPRGGLTVYTLLRPSGGSAGSCSRTAAQQWVNAVAAQHSRRSRQQQWVEGLSGGAKAPPASPAPRPCMGPNESGLDAGARLKTPRPIYIYIDIHI